MAGCKKRRQRFTALSNAPSHSWIHAGHYSVGDPDNVAYFLCTPHGPFTIQEEYMCWVYASTGKFRMSARMAYGRPRTVPMKDKERKRVVDLIDMDNNGVIDLKVGPWKYYGFEIGDPSAFIKPEIKDYGKCLIPQITCQTII